MDWPETLPAPLLAGYGGEDKPNLRRTEMETGPARVERFAAAHTIELSISWDMSPEQMATFAAFYRDSISSGADWFDIPVDTGGGLLRHRCRFKDGYKFARSGPYYVVNATLETDENHILWS